MEGDRKVPLQFLWESNMEWKPKVGDWVIAAKDETSIPSPRFRKGDRLLVTNVSEGGCIVRVDGKRGASAYWYEIDLSGPAPEENPKVEQFGPFKVGDKIRDKHNWHGVVISIEEHDKYCEYHKWKDRPKDSVPVRDDRGCGFNLISEMQLDTDEFTETPAPKSQQEYRDPEIEHPISSLSGPLRDTRTRAQAIKDLGSQHYQHRGPKLPWFGDGPCLDAQGADE